MIEARGPYKSDGGVSVLRDVTLAPAGGSRAALPGAGGSGRITLLALRSTPGRRARSGAVPPPVLSLPLLAGR